MNHKAKWYTKLRYLFPLAFLVGALAAFIEDLIKDLIQVLGS